jgi:secreted trypsin-like serine protease
LGIVSWGEQCGESFKPGIFTQIPSYYQWIESAMRNN